MSTISKIKVGGTIYNISSSYPVGSIYLSVNGTSPAELFGGTWEQLKDRFLLAAGDTYAAGSTGGEAQHTHKYGLQFGSFYGSISIDGVLQDGVEDPVGGVNVGESVSSVNSNAIASVKSQNMMHVKSTADTSSASNMPPYLAVYMWKRIA